MELFHSPSWLKRLLNPGRPSRSIFDEERTASASTSRPLRGRPVTNWSDYSVGRMDPNVCANGADCRDWHSFEVLRAPVLPSAPVLIGMLICLYELHYMHGTGRLYEEERPGAASRLDCALSLPPEIRFRYWLFASRRFPIFTICLLVGPVLTVSSLAWLGLLDRHVWVNHILSMLILGISWSMPAALIVQNIVSLRRYLPQRWQDWKNNGALLPSWWTWFACKLVFGSSDNTQIIFTAIWYISLVWFTWPFRFFFFHRHVVFVANPDIADVFVLNMALHAALLVAWCMYLNCVAFGTSRFISRTVWKLSRKYWVQATFFFTLCNSALCVLRVVWFMLSNIFVLSLWGQWTVLAFTHLHIAVNVSVLFIYYSVLQRESVWTLSRNAFVEDYIRVHLDSKGRQTAEGLQALRGDLTREADHVFASLLDATSRHFVFREASPRAGAGAEKEEQNGEQPSAAGEDYKDTDAASAKQFFAFMTDVVVGETYRQ